MKKVFNILILVIVLILVGVGGFFLLKSTKKSPQSSAPTPTPETVVTEVPLEEKPYIALTPRADGKEFTLDISRIKNTDTVEYELVYLSQGLSRGVIGSVDLKGESSLSRKLLLGSCSKNVCKYDEGVEQGTLTLRFKGPEGTRKLNSDFHLQKGVKELTSIDGGFKLTGKLSANAFYVVMSTMGLPGEIKGKVVGSPYGVFTAGSQIVKNTTVTLSLSEKSTTVKLSSWDGKAWNEEKKDFKNDGETVSASVDSLGTFVAVASE